MRSPASFPCLLQLLALAIRNGIAGSSATKSFKYLYDLLRPTRLTGSTKLQDCTVLARTSQSHWPSVHGWVLGSSPGSIGWSSIGRRNHKVRSSIGCPSDPPLNELPCLYTRVAVGRSSPGPTDPTRGAHPTTAWLHSDAPPRLSFDGHSSTQDHCAAILATIFQCSFTRSPRCPMKEGLKCIVYKLIGNGMKCAPPGHCLLDLG